MPENAHDIETMVGAYSRRMTWWYRLLSPPLPLVSNPHERHLPQPIRGPCLLLGGAGQVVPWPFVNVDIASVPGVHVKADGARLPFRDGLFTMIECDAMLEHVSRPDVIISELQRVLMPGGLLHIVVPFNHPFHGYPSDYHRWTLRALRDSVAPLEIVDAGVRTGPAAAWLLCTLQFIKILLPGLSGKAVGAAAGWVLWPVRYLDYWLYRTDRAHILANSLYVLARRPEE